MQRRFNFRKLFSVIEAAAFQLSKIMALIAAAFLSLMMLLTVVDVSGRYFFNIPLNGAWEMIGLSLVCVGTWALANCQKEKGHVNVTVLLHRFSPRMEAAVLGVGYLLGLVTFSIISWGALTRALRYSLEKGYYTDMLHIPYFPFLLIMAIGIGMLALLLLFDLIQAIGKVVRE
jgi:TRAP-type C4-dicarboxylate transport system permease small subunit